MNYFALNLFLKIGNVYGGSNSFSIVKPIPLSKMVALNTVDRHSIIIENADISAQTYILCFTLGNVSAHNVIL